MTDEDTARLPALLRAVLESGYVIDDEGTNSRSGLIVPRWQLDIVAALPSGSHGMVVNFDSYAQALTTAAPELSDYAISWELRNYIRAASTSADPARRYWATFVNEVGLRRGANNMLAPDICACGDTLDTLQVHFITWELMADLLAPGAPVTSAPPRTDVEPKPKCVIDDPVAGYIIKTAEEVLSGSKGALIDYLESKGVGGAKGYGRALLVAQPLLDLLRFYLIWTSLSADWRTLGPPPLERTEKSFADGAEINIHVTLSYKLPISILNCFRLMLSVYGVTFGVPPEGAAVGLRGSWRIGNDEFGNSASGVDGFVQLFTGFRQGEEQPRVLGATTDATGHAVIQVQGLHQNHDIVQPAARVIRTADVWFEVPLEGNELGEDMIGLISDVVTVDPISIGMSMMARMVDLSFRYPLKVRDWAETSVALSGGSSGSQSRRFAAHLSVAQGVPTLGLAISVDSRVFPTPIVVDNVIVGYENDQNTWNVSVKKDGATLFRKAGIEKTSAFSLQESIDVSAVTTEPSNVFTIVIEASDAEDYYGSIGVQTCLGPTGLANNC